MTHKISSDGAAAVAPEFHWIPIGPSTPKGVSLLLYSEAAGVLQKGQHTSSDKFFTHWAPCPTLPKDTK